MDTFLQMAVAFGALSGWGAVIFGIAWHVSAQRRELLEAREARSRQRRALQFARARLEAIEGRHRRQLEQTRILFEIEEVLAERLAEAQGGAARTRKIEARNAAEERLGGDLRLNRRITSPTGVADELRRLEEDREEIGRILEDDDVGTPSTTSREHPPAFSLAA